MTFHTAILTGGHVTVCLSACLSSSVSASASCHSRTKSSFQFTSWMSQ